MSKKITPKEQAIKDIRQDADYQRQRKSSMGCINPATITERPQLVNLN